jgi:hypothetical protein
MFTEHPTYNPYRNIKFVKGQPLSPASEDVFAIQTGLLGDGYEIATDGVFGSESERVVKQFQKDFKLTEDGIPGQETQRKIAVNLITDATNLHGLEHLLLYGQIAHECGFFLGNYTPVYENGSWDSGAAQENSKVHPVRVAFTTPTAINDCASSCKAHYMKFEGVAGVKRRWALAAGAWNRPAYAGYIADEEGAKVPRSEIAQPSDAARATLEAYMKSVTAYVK